MKPLPGRRSRHLRWVALAAVTGAAALMPVPLNQAAAAPAAPAPIPAVELQIENRLHEALPATVRIGADANLRTLVRGIALRQLDGDTDALFSTVIAEAEANGFVNPNEGWWVGLKSEVGSFVVDGHRYEPQINIPGIEEGVPLSDRPDIVVRPANESAETAQAYHSDPNGSVTPTSYLIDEPYLETHEVWVISVHEKGSGGVTLAAAPAGSAVAGPQGASTLGACDPNGMRNDKGSEYIHVWKASSKTVFGGLFSGKTEMKLVVVSQRGAVATLFMPKIKRKQLTTWQRVDLPVTTWDTAVWGQVMAYQWFEVDDGNPTTYTVNVPAQGGNPGFSTSIQSTDRDDDGGSAPVLFQESTFKEYNTNRVQFQVCSQGGDPTGNANLACNAAATASTTYPGYSPARATDCNPSTQLGEQFSWANDSSTYAPTNPQWLQIDFGTTRTFTRIDLYTTQGYPIRHFDVYVLNGSTFTYIGGGWENTATMVRMLFAQQTTQVIRIVGRHGPSHQPGYVRINEVEVYAR